MLREERRGSILVLTLDNPPVNAISTKMYEALAETFQRINNDDEVDAVVLTGAGDRVFSAGQDVREIRDSSMETSAARKQILTRAMNAIFECTKPVVAAVNGVVVGAGVIMLSMCDVLVSAEHAEFKLTEIDVGIIGGARHAMRLFPLPVVRYLALSGLPITARQAHSMGAVIQVTPPGEELDAAIALATVLAAKGSAAIRMWKETLRTIEQLSLLEGSAYEQRRSLELQALPESRARAAAFFERRGQ